MTPSTPTFTPTPFPSGSITIDYVYDPLNRLTEANYSINNSPTDYYHYTYDAAGNRKTQQSMIGGLPSTSSYNYDHANRLTDVNGLLYTWDDNGNLLNDGVNAYTYDSANRLKTLAGPSDNASYSYNGLGDRLQETLNGQTTTFTMDLNTGLTQALSDGTNNYIYGNGRIAQAQGSVTEYFLGDALGSVRQLTNSSGAVTYGRAYDPYGVVTLTSGSSQSSYGYTAEYSDSYIKLIYLRSRWYSPYITQFIQPDTIVPDPYQPMDWNKYLYVQDNPINYTDPSGHHYNYGENLPDLRDLTDWLPRAAVYMANDPEVQEIKRLHSSPYPDQNLLGLFKFYNIVRDGSRFDVKDKVFAKLGRDIKLGDNWYEFSVTGNILYGFVGSVTGYGEQTLHKGAGYAQITDNLRWVGACSGLGVLYRALFGGKDPGPFPDFGGPAHYFDTPNDYHAVDFGIWLDKKYYVPTGNFTRDNFVQGLNNYELAWGLPGVPDPGNYIPNTSGPYAPDEFNQ